MATIGANCDAAVTDLSSRTDSRARSGPGTSDRKRRWSHGFAGAHDFSEVRVRAAMEHEPRKVALVSLGTIGCDCIAWRGPARRRDCCIGSALSVARIRAMVEPRAG